MTYEQFKSFDVQPPPDAIPAKPQEINIVLDDIKEVGSKKRK